MLCPICKKEIPGASTICPRCRRAIAPDPQTTQLYIAADRLKKLVIWVAAVTAIVLLVIVAYSVNQSRLSGPEDHMTIDPFVAKQHTAAEAPVGATDESKAKAIADYIDFLSGIEKRRTVLRQSFDDAVHGVVHPPAPAGAPATPAAPGIPPSTTDLAQYQQEWQNVVRDFNAKQIPPGAEFVSNNYYRVLQDYVALLSTVGQNTTAPDTVTRLLTDAQTKIQADALTADQSLQQACSAAHITQPFTIAPELTAPRDNPPPGATSSTP